MKKFLYKNRKKGSFSGIKQHLDPLKSYIVFEKKIQREDDTIVAADTSIADYLEKSALEWQEIFEKSAFKIYLVIQVDPGCESSVLGNFLSQSALYDATYYIFKAEDKKNNNGK